MLIARFSSTSINTMVFGTNKSGLNIYHMKTLAFVLKPTTPLLAINITVENTCRQGSATSPVTGGTGRAIIPDEKHLIYLLISFGFPFLRGTYAVLDTDYTDYSIVASCPRLGVGRWHIWILTREQQPDEQLIEGLKNKTVGMGVSLQSSLRHIKAMTAKGS